MPLWPGACAAYAVILAAVEAIVDPCLTLLACSALQAVAPFFVVSGKKLIDELNINDSFCAVARDGRRMPRLDAPKADNDESGQTWPGNQHMKAFGSPFRYYSVIGENEAAYSGAWNHCE